MQFTTGQMLVNLAVVLAVFAVFTFAASKWRQRIQCRQRFIIISEMLIIAQIISLRLCSLTSVLCNYRLATTTFVSIFSMHDQRLLIR